MLRRRPVRGGRGAVDVEVAHARSRAGRASLYERVWEGIEADVRWVEDVTIPAEAT